MKPWLTKTLFVALACVGCGDEDTGPDPAKCDNIADQIRTVADQDPDLQNYQGFDRTSNPCADPIPITSTTDYTPACESIRGCPDEFK